MKRTREQVSQDKEIQQFEILVKIAKLNHENEKNGNTIKCDQNIKLWDEYNKIKLTN